MGLKKQLVTERTLRAQYKSEAATKCHRTLCFGKRVDGGLYCPDHQVRHTIRGCVPRVEHTVKAVDPDNGGRWW